LAVINEQLVNENAELRNKIELLNPAQLPIDSLDYATDTVFNFIPARIINNSVNRQQNYITLNKGSKHGIKTDQGIISGSGIVGVVTSVSDSYSMGLSVLNPRWSISAKLKNSGFYGSLVWDGKDYRIVKLNEIPFHIDLAIGDTVVTSGYSSIFPDGLMIGTISEFIKPSGENYYDISVQLATNFKSVAYVEVIDNHKADELDALKQQTEYGESNN
jgi:rod shape-determining protein MreC